MVYSGSLNVPVGKALGKNARQSNLNKICSQMCLDPASTSMDVVILGPKDLVGPRLSQVQQAVDNKHPDICVIFLYEKDNESDLLEGVYAKKCKKINQKTVQEAFEEFVGDHEVRAGKHQMTSADFQEPEEAPVPKAPSSFAMSMEPGDDDDDEFSDVFNAGPRVTPMAKQEEPVQEPVQEPLPVDEPETPFIEPQPMTTDTSFQDVLTSPIPQTPPVAAVNYNPTDMRPVGKMEDQLSKITNPEDWAIFKESLNRDSIVRQLIEENSEYEGLVNMLEVLDRRIQIVFRDSGLSPEQKFDKIKAIGLERAAARATQNSLNVDKVISIISTICLAAKRTVDAKINTIDTALYKVAADKAAIMDTSYIDKVMEERTKVQLDLLNVSRSIVDIYKSIDTLVNEEIQELDRKLPSSNEFVNGMVAPLGTQIFTPQNTALLAKKLLSALQENRLVWSQMESAVTGVIEKLFALCEQDEEIIKYQRHMIDLLKSNNVEQVIITDSLLKRVFRIFTGADNTGRSSTAITWCGLLSRRNNTLLLDFTGKSKFREYGITPVPLNDFLSNRIERPFLCVESRDILGPDELQEVIQQLKARLNYYQYVNVIMAPEDKQGINQMCEDALCIHYITDCSTSSINILRDLVAQNTVQNVARKLITIDAPISPLSIADNIGIDPTQTKIITLPAIPAIKACALRHDRPYEYTEVASIYEEVFR